MKPRQFLKQGLAAAWCVLAPHIALAQAGASAPPLKIVVATPAGGASDTVARLLGQALAKATNRQVLVENKPGGNGVPALLAVQAAPADGHTLLWAQSSMTGMPLLVKSAPVRPISEFVPVAPVVDLVYGLFVNPGKVPAATVSEFRTQLQANPDRLSYGTGVLGEYMVTMQFLRATGLKALRVPYKGGVQLLPDLVSGDLQFNIGPLAPVMPHIRSGKLRLLATLPERSPVAPGVPSLAEAGVNLDAFPTWNALVAPPGTPADAAARLSHDVNRALADPALRAALEAQGFKVTGGSPQQLAAAVESASAAWRQFIREHDIPQE